MNLKKLTRIILIVAVLLLLSVVPVNAVVFNAAFDSDFYVNCYPDLKAAFGDDANAAYNHYLTYGIKEGRIASPVFDVKAYIRNYPDLQAAFGDDYVAAYNHFLTNGMNEGRLASDSFNVQVYIANYPDLQAAFGNDVAGAYSHYLNYGMAEGRVCGALEAGATAPEDHVHEFVLTKMISTVTCINDGEGIYTCEVDGETEIRVIPASALYHDYQLDEEKSKTAGVNVYVCTICDDIKVELPEGVDHVHDYVEVVEARIPATCTSEGKIVKQCQNKDCNNDTITEVIPMIPHESTTAEGEGFNITKAVKCTSNSTGAKDGSERVECWMCGQMFIREISAHNYNEGVITKEPTCTEAGEKLLTCKDCGATKTEEVKALGHDYADTKAIEIVPATCETTGKSILACRRCGESETIITKALGHELPTTPDSEIFLDSKGKAVKVTVTEEGVEKELTTVAELEDLDPEKYNNCNYTLAGIYTCTRGDDECNAKNNQVQKTIKAATGHMKDSNGSEKGIATIVAPITNGVYNYEEYDYVRNDKGEIVFDKNAKVDCEHEEVEVFTCKNCSNTVTAVHQARKVHTGNVEKINATCTEPGYTITSCTSCNKVIKEATTEQPLKHNVKIVAATCTEDAYIGCTRCNARLTTDSDEYKTYLKGLTDTKKAQVVETLTGEASGHKFVGIVTPTTTGKAEVLCATCGKKVEVDYTEGADKFTFTYKHIVNDGTSEDVTQDISVETDATTGVIRVAVASDSGSDMPAMSTTEAFEIEETIEAETTDLEDAE